MMDELTNNYLRDLLQKSGNYVPSKEDGNLLKKVGLEKYIKSKLFSKKYRKWRVDEECRVLVDNEVSSAISENRPIRLFFAQGCYKLWRVESSPMPNWAEFFNLAYLVAYLSPVVASFQPGVELTYYFLTVLPQMHNNLSQKEVDEYKEGFLKILKIFQKYLPQNFIIKLTTELEEKTRSQYDDELQRAMVYAEERFYSWTQAKQTDYIRRAWLNIKWNGVEPWHITTEEQKTRLVKRAVLYEYAATQDILENDKKGRGIILSTLPKEASIGIGSTYTSVAKHWVGEGVLERYGENGFHARILSPSQYDLAQMTPHSVIDLDLLPLSGFDKIEVYPNYFDFTKK